MICDVNLKTVSVISMSMSIKTPLHKMASHYKSPAAPDQVVHWQHWH